MIKIAFEGGLGNQMFQYTMGRYLQLKFNEPVTYDISRYIFENDEIRDFELLNFNMDPSWSKAPSDKSRQKRFGISYLAYCAFTWIYLKLNADRFLHYKPLRLPKTYNAIINRLGHYRVHFNNYETPRRYSWTKTINVRGMWFWMDMAREMRPIIKNELTVRTPISDLNRNTLDMIRSTNSVGVHIRRGDYVKLGLIVCDINYYQQCIRRMASELKDPVFFIFSDDIEWVQENLNIPDGISVIYVDNNNSSSDDMRLLSNCAHFIMSNSTFSWWGAFLGDHPDKKVYVPRYWTHRNHQSLFALPEWTIIDNRNL